MCLILFGSSRGSKQADFPGDGASTPLLFLFGSFGGKEQGAHIPVAKAIDGKFPAIDDFQETGVLDGPRVECAITLAVFAQPLANGLGFFAQGRLFIHHGQGAEITLIGRVADLSPLRQIGHAPPQDTPSLLLFRVVLVARHTLNSFG